MKKLTPPQLKILRGLSEGKVIYVIPMSSGTCSYSYDKDNTANRLYLTLTCRSLVKRDLCINNLSKGILELNKVYTCPWM